MMLIIFNFRIWEELSHRLTIPFRIAVDGGHYDSTFVDNQSTTAHLEIKLSRPVQNRPSLPMFKLVSRTPAII